MQKIRMRKFEKFEFEGAKIVSFFSKGCPDVFGCPAGFQALEIQITSEGGAHSFQVLTIDPAFAEKERKFQGLVSVFHKSSWTIRREDVRELGLKLVHFFFPERDDGGREVLMAYVDSATLLRLCKDFIC